MIKLIIENELKNNQGNAIPLLVGNLLSISFIGQSEVNTFMFKIIEKQFDKGIILTLKEFGQSEEKSRRQYFRLENVNLFLEANEVIKKNSKIKATVSEGSNLSKVYKTKLLNISAGGALFAFYNDMIPNLNALFDVTIEIDGYHPFKVKCKLVRIERKFINNEIVFLVGVSFLEIDEKDREAMINFIANEEKLKLMQS